MKQQNLFSERRLKLGQFYSRTLFIIPSGREAARSHSVHYRFKPRADFAYLSGLHLAHAVLVILGDQTWLLHESQSGAAGNKDADLWGEHTSLSTSDLWKIVGIEQDQPSTLTTIINDHLNAFDRVAITLGCDQQLEAAVLSTLQFGLGKRTRKGSPLNICDSQSLVGHLRAIKSADEISKMKIAGEKTSWAHRQIMLGREGQKSLVGQTELEVACTIESHFLTQMMQWTAYETIVGSGARSTILHARASDRRITNGDLVLIDAGGEWEGYTSDVTRTLPARGTYNEAQSEIYSAVLRAQSEVLAAIRPGQTLPNLNELAMASLEESLRRLGIEAGKVKELMPHSTSHWLGMDVHDPSRYFDDQGEPIRLQVGMTFTVEPGLYFRNPEISEKYLGIGVRIEDDVVVRENGHEPLSSAPREIEEIEGLMAIAGG